VAGRSTWEIEMGVDDAGGLAGPVDEEGDAEAGVVAGAFGAGGKACRCRR
jgi:hypothetical protein